MIEVYIFGDIIGHKALDQVIQYKQRIPTSQNTQFFLVNAENAAEGYGITQGIYEKLVQAKFDVVTTGNHVWDQKEILHYISRADRLIRPHNMPSSAPGQGYTIVEKNGFRLAVMQLMGRVFMKEMLDCPFRKADQAIQEINAKGADSIIIDMHGEATSEKCAIGHYLDGRIGGIVGTHTHIPTADEYVMPNGTAYQTDLGACCARHSVIGMNADSIFPRFLSSIWQRAKIETNSPLAIRGAKITLNKQGKAENIERIQDFIN